MNQFVQLVPEAQKVSLSVDMCTDRSMQRPPLVAMCGYRFVDMFISLFSEYSSCRQPNTELMTIVDVM